MKKTFSLFLFAFLLCSGLLGCSDNSNEKLSDEFNEHLKNYYELEDSASSRPLFLSEKLKFYESSLDIEKVEYGTYHIVATMGNWLNPSDQLWSIPFNELKDEMRNFADAVIDFAREKDMDNDYYLYIKIYEDLLLSFVYDYEKDILYLPQKYDLYCEMYSRFGTTSEYEITKSSEGMNWLVLNGFGEIKHKQYESIWDYAVPGVYIDDDGVFKSYRLDRGV